MNDINDIKALIEQQGEIFNQHKTRLDDLTKQIDTLAIKAARPNGALFGNVPDTGERKAFGAWMRTGAEVKAMQSNIDPEGGYLLPSPLHDEISKAMKELSPMRGLARVVDMGPGSTLQFVHSRGGTGASWVGETQTRAETDTPDMASASIQLCELYSMPAVTQRLLDDAGFDVETWLATELAEQFAESEGAAFISGNGITQPRGLFDYGTAATADATRAWGTFQHVVTGANGAFHTTKTDPLVDLVMAVKPAYRQRGSWLMSTEVLTAIRKMKESSTDRPLWEPSVQAGVPSTLLGYPVYVDDRVPALATGSLSLAFGDFARAYTIVQRMPIRMLRDPYTAKPYVRFYSSMRVGGGMVDSCAVKFLRFST